MPGWVLKKVWDSSEELWEDAFDEEVQERPRGPYASYWVMSSRVPQEQQKNPLPPTENQYCLVLADERDTFRGVPPKYVSDGPEGLQTLLCQGVPIPDLTGFQRSLLHLLLFNTLITAKTLAQVSTLTCLRGLSLAETGLQEVPTTWRSSLKKLEKLSITNKPGLRALLTHLSCLRILYVFGNKSYVKSFPRRLVVSDVLTPPLPENLECLPALQTLYLHGSVTLKTIPSSLGSLSSLQRLFVSRCEFLKTLPESLGRLPSLQLLDIGRCYSFRSLPSSLGGLSSLETLSIEHCEVFEALPESLGSLSSLGSLRIENCDALRALPSSLGSLSSLRYLCVRNCNAFQGLPSSLGSLTSLESLDLKSCRYMETLPESLGNLSSLLSLTLSECYSLRDLPSSVGGLVSLTYLSTNDCRSLRDLEKSLDSLSRLAPITTMTTLRKHNL